MAFATICLNLFHWFELRFERFQLCLRSGAALLYVPTWARVKFYYQYPVLNILHMLRGRMIDKTYLRIEDVPVVFFTLTVAYLLLFFLIHEQGAAELPNTYCTYCTDRMTPTVG